MRPEMVAREVEAVVVPQPESAALLAFLECDPRMIASPFTIACMEASLVGRFPVLQDCSFERICRIVTGVAMCSA